MTSVDQTDAPYLPIDNSAVENAPRAVAVGRKYCLHLRSDRGGRTAAALMNPVHSGRGPGNAPHA
jgi:transposase